MNEVYRKEKKYVINQIELSKCINFLDQLMEQDSHNKFGGYNIRSLYFDTLNDKDFIEKEEGIRIRRKIRLRIYDPNQDFAMLEMKQKNGEYQLKRSLKITRNDAIELINGNYRVLLNYEEKFAAECYGLMHMQCYRPKTIVEYNRKAYIAKENKIRITFDSDIRCNEVNYNIFDEKLILNNVFDKSNIVLEIKYNGFLLSYIKDFLNRIDKSEVSVSKYCLGRHITKYYQYM